MNKCQQASAPNRAPLDYVRDVDIVLQGMGFSGFFYYELDFIDQCFIDGMYAITTATKIGQMRARRFLAEYP